MKVLLLRANPRKQGYTERLTNLFKEGLHRAGARVKDVDLTRLSITHCDGCYHCWVATPGQCVHSDDMGPLLEQVIESDVLVCATPMYYYSMAVSLKAFFERLLPLSAPGVHVSRGGFSRNAMRYADRWGQKKLLSIVVGAFKEPEVYQPVRDTFRFIAESIDMEFGGQLTRPESALLDYRLSKPKTLKAIETAFIKAGHQAATTGRFTPEVMEAASTSLAASPEHFRLYSRYYWETAERMGQQGLDPAEVQKVVAVDVRILMREMVRAIDPKATSHVRAVLEFDFHDLPLVYHVNISHGQCKLAEGRAERPDLTIRCSSTAWAGLFTRQVDAREALAKRQIELKGDKSLFARMERFFPPPSV